MDCFKSILFMVSSVKGSISLGSDRISFNFNQLGRPSISLVLLQVLIAANWLRIGSLLQLILFAFFKIRKHIRELLLISILVVVLRDALNLFNKITDYAAAVGYVYLVAIFIFDWEAELFLVYMSILVN
jgi:hypothetical protein